MRIHEFILAGDFDDSAAGFGEIFFRGGHQCATDAMLLHRFVHDQCNDASDRFGTVQHHSPAQRRHTSQGAIRIWSDQRDAAGGGPSAPVRQNGFPTGRIAKRGKQSREFRGIGFNREADRQD